MQYQSNILGVMQFFADCISKTLEVFVDIPLFEGVNLFTLLVGISIFRAFLIFLKTVIFESTFSATPFTVTGMYREKRADMRLEKKYQAREAARDKKRKETDNGHRQFLQDKIVFVYDKSKGDK